MSHPTARKRAGIAGIALAASFAFAAIPAAADAAPVGLGTAGSFSVLAGSTVTNTGPTTMSAQLGLDPGSAVTGAPVAAARHINDGPARQAKSDLVTAYNDAAGQASTALATAELSGRRFVAGAYKASSALRLSAGSVTLDAQGDPNAVFIFQIGSTLISGSGTSVSLVNGAQACNVFWQVGSSATFGTGTTFVGTVMALTTITANTAATFNGPPARPQRRRQSRHEHDHHVRLRSGNHGRLGVDGRSGNRWRLALVRWRSAPAGEPVDAQGHRAPAALAGLARLARFPRHATS